MKCSRSNMKLDDAVIPWDIQYRAFDERDVAEVRKFIGFI